MKIKGSPEEIAKAIEAHLDDLVKALCTEEARQSDGHYVIMMSGELEKGKINFRMYAHEDGYYALGIEVSKYR